uniref:Kazal-like domain-containing protein n=1 Tax=Salix viminalis TaxID=40686 RepID=A0A6N2LBL5_SALVM
MSVNCFRVDPVCGVDGVTYWCGCDDALCSGTRVAKLGACEVGSGGALLFPKDLSIKIASYSNSEGYC